MHTIPLPAMIVVAILNYSPLNEWCGSYQFMINQVMEAWARKESAYQFVCIEVSQKEEDQNLSTVFKKVSLGKAPTFSFSSRRWLNKKLKQILQKEKVNMLIAPAGVYLQRLPVPLCVWVQDFSFLPKKRKTRKLLPKGRISQLQQNLDQAKIIFASTQFVQQNLEETFHVAASKIIRVQPFADASVMPVDINEKIKIKKILMQDKEYFMHAGNYYNDEILIELLKAYSVFKKRQLSGMKLLIALQNNGDLLSFKKMLASYKYRNDIVLKENATRNEIKQWLGAAYGFILCLQDEVWPAYLPEAMQTGIPILAYPTALVKELAGDVPLYAHAMEYTALAEKMMLLYKDETLLTEQVKKGIEKSASIDFEKIVDSFRANLTRVIG